MKSNSQPLVRVLLIEADSSASRAVELYLRGMTSQNLFIKTASTSEQLRAAVRESWDAFLLDADNDSPAQAELLEEAKPHISHLPVIRLGKGSGDFITSGAETTLDETLPRIPVAAAPLFRSVSHLLERRRLERKIEELEVKLLEASRVDPISGLLNEPSMRERLLQEFNFAARYRHPLTLCLFEVSGFEAINDSYGYEVANGVLLECGKMVLASTRTTDFASRLGSGLFCVALPSSDVPATLVAIERLRDAVKHKIFSGKSCENFTIEAAYGVAQIDPKHKQLSDLLNAAREALQAAKSGRPGQIEVNYPISMAG